MSLQQNLGIKHLWWEERPGQIDGMELPVEPPLDPSKSTNTWMTVQYFLRTLVLDILLCLVTGLLCIVVPSSWDTNYLSSLKVALRIYYVLNMLGCKFIISFFLCLISNTLCHNPLPYSLSAHCFRACAICRRTSKWFWPSYYCQSSATDRGPVQHGFWKGFLTGSCWSTHREGKG